MKKRGAEAYFAPNVVLTGCFLTGCYAIAIALQPVLLRRTTRYACAARTSERLVIHRNPPRPKPTHRWLASSKTNFRFRSVLVVPRRTPAFATARCASLSSKSASVNKNNAEELFAFLRTSRSYPLFAFLLWTGEQNTILEHFQPIRNSIRFADGLKPGKLWIRGISADRLGEPRRISRLTSLPFTPFPLVNRQILKFGGGCSVELRDQDYRLIFTLMTGYVTRIS